MVLSSVYLKDIVKRSKIKRQSEKLKPKNTIKAK